MNIPILNVVILWVVLTNGLFIVLNIVPAGLSNGKGYMVAQATGPVRTSA